MPTARFDKGEGLTSSAGEKRNRRERRQCEIRLKRQKKNIGSADQEPFRKYSEFPTEGAGDIIGLGERERF